MSIFSKSSQCYIPDYGALVADDRVVLCFEGGSIVLLVEVRVTVFVFNELAFLVTFAFIHFEVELVLVLEVSLDFELIQHIFFQVVVFGSLFVVLLFLQEAQVCSVRGLCPLSVFTLWDPIFEC